MSLKIQGGIVNIGTYHDNSREYNIDARGRNLAEVLRACDAEEIEQVQEVKPVHVENDNQPIDSIIFTKKAKKEGKEHAILQALQNSLNGRNDKTRAFVHELKSWIIDDYIGAHYNAQVMYDELANMIDLPFGYDGFKRLYNNTRN